VIRSHIHLAMAVTLAIVLAGCSRGPSPPAPTEDLTPTVIGVIGEQAGTLPVSLVGGSTFPPSSSASVVRIRNWPNLDAPQDPSEDLVRLDPGVLLLAGQRADGSWWYELAGEGGSVDEGCWTIRGGSFDEGDSVRLSSGLRLPKAPGFRIETHGHDSDNVQWFPGHGGDGICIDEQGRAVYFDAFIGR